MRFLVTGLLALFTVSAFAHPPTVWANGAFRAVIHLPHDPDMGDTEIPGKLYVGRRAAIELSCTYSTGVTTSLFCSGSGYTLQGYGGLTDLEATLPGGGTVKLRSK